MQNGSCDWFILLPPQRKDSSHSCSAPVWSLSHWRQSSMIFFVLPMGCDSSQTTPLWIQSLRNRLLQQVCPARSQVLLATLLHHVLLPPWGHRSCQEPCPGRVIYRPLPGIHLPCCGVLHGPELHICRLQRDSCCTMQLLHCGLHRSFCSGAWSTSSTSLL